MIDHAFIVHCISTGLKEDNVRCNFVFINFHWFSCFRIFIISTYYFNIINLIINYFKFLLRNIKLMIPQFPRIFKNRNDLINCRYLKDDKIKNYISEKEHERFNEC